MVEWARTTTWNGVQPVVTLIEKTYDKGVRIAKAAFKAVESRLQRDTILPKYDVSDKIERPFILIGRS